jgi:thiopurine S-methyltransferase
LDGYWYRSNPLACRDFFFENNLAFTESLKKEKKVFEGDKIIIYCEDLFSLSHDDIGEVDAVYDRGALIALPKELRSQYVNHVTNLLCGIAIHSEAKSKRYLLIALEYPQDRVQGPPFSVDEGEVKTLYHTFFKVIEAEREEDIYLPANNKKFEGIRVFETTYFFSGE